jgi:hypothetical protein
MRSDASARRRSGCTHTAAVNGLSTTALMRSRTSASSSTTSCKASTTACSMSRACASRCVARSRRTMCALSLTGRVQQRDASSPRAVQCGPIHPLHRGRVRRASAAACHPDLTRSSEPGERESGVVEAAVLAELVDVATVDEATRANIDILLLPIREGVEHVVRAKRDA